MKTMKKAVSIFAAAVMMLTFTACGQSDSISRTSQEQSSSTSIVTNNTSDSANSSTENSSDSDQQDSNTSASVSTDSTPQSQNSSAQSNSEPASEPVKSNPQSTVSSSVTSSQNGGEPSSKPTQSTVSSFVSSSQNGGETSSKPAQSTTVSSGSSSQSGTSSSKPISSTPQSVSSSTVSLPTTPEPESKTLIVYFSWSPSGKTTQMAEFIQEKTGGDLIRLEPVNAYPTVYQKCGEVALEERDSNARPKISNLPGSIDEYDTVFVGYPIWWHTAPMIIGTFLESYDLTGVDIYPFTQSDSMDEGQFGQSMEFVRGCAKGANVHDGLFTRPANTDIISEYLTANGF